MRLRGPDPAVMIFAITSAIFLSSPVRGLTDSRYSTLVSEALFRHGSFVLDEWFGDRANLPYQVETVGGHVYYWYPPGGPVLATPFVWVLAQLGLSAVGHGGSYDSGHDRIVQAVLAALFMGLLAVIFLKTAANSSASVELDRGTGGFVGNASLEYHLARALERHVPGPDPRRGGVATGLARDEKAASFSPASRDASSVGVLRPP